MKRMILPLLGVGAALVLQGCTAAEQPAEPTATVTVTASPTASPETGTEATASASPAASKESAAAPTPDRSVTTAFEDSRRTVFTLDSTQISAFTGLDAFSAPQDEIVDKLSEQARWEAEAETKKYAKLIAAAADSERESAQNALAKLRKDPQAKLRVYVSHNQHAEIAHIGVTHDR